MGSLGTKWTAMKQIARAKNFAVFSGSPLIVDTREIKATAITVSMDYDCKFNNGDEGSRPASVRIAELIEGNNALLERYRTAERRAYDAEQELEKLQKSSFQSRVKPWLDACFGAKVSVDKIERNHRFLEESLELVQSNGCTKDEAQQLVEYVYARDVGEINQEVGGVMVTLAALCLSCDIDMHKGGEMELDRVWSMIGKIREKQAAKPKHSPLPQ